MKAIRYFLAMLMLAPLAQAQFNPPPVGAYSLDTGLWAPITGTGSTGSLGYTPPPAALYCQNGSGVWVAWTTAACGGGGGTGTVTSVSVTTANGVSGSVATATTTPEITLTLGAITPTSTNGVSAATMAFMDATSSVQTQLNGKQATLTLPLSATNGGTGLDTHTSTGVAQVSSGTWSVSTTLPSGLAATNLTLTTPSLGAATATSLLASGIVDGQAPVTVTTGSSATLGGTYKSGYTFNEHATAGTAITYTLPTAAAGLQYCVGNAYNGSAANTGTLEILTSASGQFIIFTDGTLSATGGYVISGGAAADFACVVGVDSTHWYFKPSSGTWTKH